MSTPRGLRRYLPILEWLPRYDRTWLAQDAVAGLSVWALLVPQSLGYATLAGVPVQYGLYTAFAALLAYALFGVARQVVTGPSGAVCAVVASVITPLVGAAALGTSAAAPYAAALALAAAVLYIALGLLRMGWISTFLSKAVMAGFVLGFSLGIIIDQSHKLLGVPSVDGSYVQELWGTLQEIPDTSGITLLIGAGSLAILLTFRRVKPKWPRALIVMALAILAVKVFDLQDHGLAITGNVPTGLFSIGTPDIAGGDVGALLVGALAVIFVGYSESLAASRSMGSKHGYEIDPNQELIAQGMSCGAAGLVGGFAVDGSLSKTSVADAAGQKTQMASLLNAGLVLLTILFLASIFEDLPTAVLGAVVIDAMVGLVTFKELRRYYRVDRWDWVFFMGAMAGILCVGIIAGIVIGVVLSLLLLIARSSRTPVRALGREPHSGVYHELDHRADLETTPGVLVVRIDGPLFFADADAFRAGVRQLMEENGSPTRVVIDAESVHLSDTDGADILTQLAREFRADNASLALAHVHPEVIELWRRAGVVDAIGEDSVYESIEEAVEQVTSLSPQSANVSGRSLSMADVEHAKKKDIARPAEASKGGSGGEGNGRDLRPKQTRQAGRRRSAPESGLDNASSLNVGVGLTPAERAARGKHARAEVLRSSHADWEPAANRRDPIELLEEQAATRLQELLPIRYARMLVSPFTFFRGGAYLMAADLADTPRTGLQTQLCGDAHLSNFGGFAAPDRRLVFGLNDFDETLPGPFEWDVKRLVASFAVAGRDRGFDEKERHAVNVEASRSYREAMAAFAGMRKLDVWYARLDMDELLGRIAQGGSKKQAKRAEANVAKAQTKDSLKAFAKLTEIVDGEPRIVSDPPLIVPIEEVAAGAEAEQIEELVRGVLMSYRETLGSDHRHLLEGFRYVHAARKVVGVGSVGARAWIVLLLGRDAGDPLFLQLKQVNASVLEPFLGESEFSNPGMRVVAGQRLMQAASDIMLGWTRVDQFGVEADLYVRQLWDGKQRTGKKIPKKNIHPCPFLSVINPSVNATIRYRSPPNPIAHHMTPPLTWLRVHSSSSPFARSMLAPYPP